jgi:hypothetical protein
LACEALALARKKCSLTGPGLQTKKADNKKMKQNPAKAFCLLS